MIQTLKKQGWNMIQTLKTRLEYDSNTKKQGWNMIQTLKTRLEYDPNTKKQGWNMIQTLKTRLEYDPNTKKKLGWNMIQTLKNKAGIWSKHIYYRFKRMLFIRTKLNMWIFGVIPLSSYKTTLKQLTLDSSKR